jgi:hypothetical protein
MNEIWHVMKKLQASKVWMRLEGELCLTVSESNGRDMRFSHRLEGELCLTVSESNGRDMRFSHSLFMAAFVFCGLKKFVFFFPWCPGCAMGRLGFVGDAATAAGCRYPDNWTHSSVQGIQA